MRSALQKTWAAWRRPTEALVYARLRWALAGVALYEFACNWSLLEWLRSDGPFPADQLARAMRSEFWNVDLFLWLPPDAAPLVVAVGALAAIAYAIPLGGRGAGWLLWLCLVSLRNRTAWAWGDGGLQIVPAALFFLFWAPDTRARRTAVDSWPLRLIQLQVCLIYLQSGYYKLLGAQWRSGVALKWTLLNPEFTGFALDPLLLSPVGAALCPLAGWVTLVWECAFPLLLLAHPITRVLALATGVVMHGSLWLLYTLGVFPPGMLALYLAFWPARTLGVAAPPPRWLRRTAPAAALLLLWIAWPAASLVPRDRLPPGLRLLDGACVESHALLAQVPGVSWVDQGARSLGLEHRFHTFSPAVAEWTAFYRLSLASAEEEQVLWDGAWTDPELKSRSYDPRSRLVANCAHGQHPEKVFLWMTGWQRQLDERHDLLLREWWSPLPLSGGLERFLPGRTWRLKLQEGRPVLEGPTEARAL